MDEEVKSPKINWLKEVFEMADSVILSAALVLVLFTLVFRIFVVNGSSMFPTLKDGERLVVSGLMYEPKIGDIICFYSDYKEEVLVKRVIANEGQTVDIGKDHCVYVDGEKLDEDYLDGVDTYRLSLTLPYTIKSGCVFVMGDNRGDSMDSRDANIASVDKNDILGKLVLRLFPRFGTVK